MWEEGDPPLSKRKAVPLHPRIKCVLRELRQRYRMRRLLPQLGRARAIVVGGGGLLSDDNLHFPQSLAVVAESARRLNIPLYCLGCSVEGQWSAKGADKIRKFLAACAAVAARDHFTAGRVEAVRRSPVPVFGDFCLTEAQLLEEGNWSHSRQALAINVRRIPARSDALQERYEEVLVELATRLIRSGAERLKTIRIFTTGTLHDVVPAQRVFARLGAMGVELRLPRSLDELTGVLRESALVIASRLHGAILGLAAGAPVVGFSSTPKMHNFFSTMGIGPYCFDVDASVQLMNLIGGADQASIFAAQRHALVHAPVWATRAQVRRALGSIDGAPCALRLETRWT